MVHAKSTVYDQQPSMFFCITSVFSLSSRFTLKSVLFLKKLLGTELKSLHLIFSYRNTNKKQFLLLNLLFFAWFHLLRYHDRLLKVRGRLLADHKKETEFYCNKETYISKRYTSL